MNKKDAVAFRQIIANQDAELATLRAALADCLEFIEHYSYAWNGVCAKHPNTLATTARELLKPKE